MIEILVADDHLVVRAGLRTLLHTQPDLRVVAEAADGRAALTAVSRWRPRVVLMDLRMPGMGGVAATRALAAAHPEVRVIVMTSFEGPDVTRALEAGARGHLLKDVGRSELFSTVRAAAMEPRSATPLETMRLPAADRLSTRESEVLALVAEGLTNQAIARTLTVSVSTVKTHLEHLFAKLGVRGRAAAVRVAIGRGLLVVEHDRRAGPVEDQPTPPTVRRTGGHLS